MSLNLFLLDTYNTISNYYSVVSSMVCILYLIVVISFILCYLDDFRFSSNSFIKYFQIFSFICISLFILLYLLFIYDNMMLLDIVYNVGDVNNNIGTHVNTNVNLNVNDERSGSSIALTGAMVGVGAAVGKAIAKAPMPPLQKAGAIVGASVLGGAAQVGINYVNGYLTGSGGTSTNIGSNISKFLPESGLSPLQGILWSVETMDYVCLGIIYILIIQLIFKLYFKYNVNLNLSGYLGNSFNSKLEFYLNKIIELNKKVSVFWIWFITVTILFGVSFSVYFINVMYIYLDKGIKTHSPTSNNIGTTLYGSIEDALFSLGTVNYICLATILCLVMILYFRFHFNKNISSIYIWVLLILLIIALAYSGYISSELYTNIDSYVNIYNNK